MVTRLVVVTSPEGQTGGHEPLSTSGEGERTVQVHKILVCRSEFPLGKEGGDFLPP